MVEFKDIGDLVIVAVFVGFAVVILGSLSEHKIKEWQEQGKNHYAWAAVIICLFAAITTIVISRALPVNIQVVPQTLNLEMSHTGMTLRGSAARYSIFFVAWFYFLVVGVMIITRRPTKYGIAALADSLDSASLSIVTSSIAIAFFQLLASLSWEMKGQIMGHYIEMLCAIVIFQVLILLVCASLVQRSRNVEGLSRHTQLLFSLLIGVVSQACFFATAKLILG
ncbi:MAG TPA: hypothetical protein VG844_01605 [Terracidiphilus sp.]|nr:hypothetical protein [Terracidiphilus sp.]